MAFSFLTRMNRRRDEEQNQPQAYSSTNQTQQKTQEPYEVQSLADGRVRYSDGSVRGTVRQPVERQPRQTQPTQPTYQRPTQQSLTNQYIQNRATSAGNRIGNIEDRFNQNADTQKQIFETRNKTLQNIGDISGQSFNQYANQLRGGLDIQKGTADRQIGTARQDYTDQQYQNERARQERMKGLEGTLASLGTLQSSAFGNLGARINQGAERQDRSAQRNLNTRIADIQDSVRLAENEAEGLIQQEANRYRQQIAQLSGSMDENSLKYKQAVSALSAQADERINGILDSLDQFSYEAQLAQLQQESGPSATFLQTGQPQTREDYIWMMENPDKYQEAFRGIVPQQITPEEQNARQQTMGLIEELYGSDLSPLSGVYGRTGLGTFAGSGANTKAALNQLIGRLVVDERGKLKGQGQISDREQMILQDAVTRLNTPGLNQEDIKAELSRIYNTLSGNTSQPTGNLSRPPLSSLLEN